jgi:hypothetical protein
MATTHQKKWTVRDEILISDALVHEFDGKPPSSDHPMVERLCITLPARRAAVMWKLSNHAQFRDDFVGAPTNASALSEAVAKAFIAAPDDMHRIAQALRKEVQPK